jgi:hypothetical protein
MSNIVYYLSLAVSFLVGGCCGTVGIIVLAIFLTVLGARRGAGQSMPWKRPSVEDVSSFMGPPPA